MRGPINQDGYKRYVTPILFFKRLSECILNKSTLESIEVYIPDSVLQKQFADMALQSDQSKFAALRYPCRACFFRLDGGGREDLSWERKNSQRVQHFAAPGCMESRMHSEVIGIGQLSDPAAAALSAGAVGAAKRMGAVCGIFCKRGGTGVQGGRERPRGRGAR